MFAEYKFLWQDNVKIFLKSNKLNTEQMTD